MLHIFNFFITLHFSELSPLPRWRNHCLSALWDCWLGHMTHQIVHKMTYNVLSGNLGPTRPNMQLHWQQYGLASIVAWPKKIWINIKIQWQNTCRQLADSIIKQSACLTFQMPNIKLYLHSAFNNRINRLYTGWAKKQDCFWDQITLQRMTIEIHQKKYVKSFRILSRMKYVSAIKYSLHNLHKSSIPQKLHWLWHWCMSFAQFLFEIQ